MNGFDYLPVNDVVRVEISMRMPPRAALILTTSIKDVGCTSAASTT